LTDQRKRSEPQDWTALLNTASWACPTAAQMREIDRDAIEKRGLPGRLLMENAGRAVARAVRQRFPSARRPLVVCGAGNNGGDGFVVARALAAEQDVCPTVVSLGDPARHSRETRDNFEQLVRSERLILLETRDLAAIRECAERADLLIDAVFGVGLSRPVEGELCEVLEMLAGLPLPKVAVDVPSGVSSDTGRALGVEVPADLIVTFGFPKLGLALRPLAAEVWVAEIGFPPASLAAAGVRQWMLRPEGAAALLPERPLEGHKGTFGHLLVVAGSEGKAGAAILAAHAALRSGVGLVTLAAPRAVYPILAAKLSEAMTLPLADAGRGVLLDSALDVLVAEGRTRDALVIGPGVGRDASTERAVRDLLAVFAGPALVDADALNAFEGRAEELRGGLGPRVLTPHPGEAARLLDCETAEVQSDRAAAARELAQRTQACVVLKGARSAIATPDGTLLINPSGGPALAAGGSGDVLSGVIGALLAQGLPPLDAAALGAYLHGRAGEGALMGRLASEVADGIPRAWHELAQRSGDGDESADLRPFP
jgi:ADP-dependent NAD(P)H-hydrate dehydratase / NAD(P)H-hydrate epimerase